MKTSVPKFFFLFLYLKRHSCFLLDTGLILHSGYIELELQYKTKREKTALK